MTPLWLRSSPWGQWPCRMCGAKLLRFSLGKAQPLVVLRHPQSCGSILWELAAEEGSCRPLYLPSHFTATCRKAAKSGRTFLIWFTFVVVLCSEFSFPSALKGKFCLERAITSHISMHIPPLG